MAATTKGNCYLCGAQLGKAAMGTHMAKMHGGEGAEQECYVLKIEGAYDKGYWLLVDMPKTASLQSLDGFLRKIWLECCGHMSGFFAPGRDQVGKARKISSLSVGEKLVHEYDFGTTTETLITVVRESTRPKQRESVRLLARNVPPVFACEGCGVAAGAICTECAWEKDNPFLCEDCAEHHEHGEMLLAITNSPRMGECGYDGELDVYEFDPQWFAK